MLDTMLISLVCVCHDLTAADYRSDNDSVLGDWPMACAPQHNVLVSSRIALHHAQPATAM
jgi:hypothetical protein